MARARRFQPEYDRVDRANIKHVQLTEPLLRSAAWNALSYVSRSLLIEFLRLHNGMNNGQIVLGVREAANRLGCTKNTAHKALQELQEKGFLHRVIRGHFGLGEREASVWRLAIYGTSSNRRPTAEYLTWQPGHTPNQETKHRSQSLGQPVSSADTDKMASVAISNTNSINNCDGELPDQQLAGTLERDTIRLPRGTAHSGCNIDFDQLRQIIQQWLDAQPRGAQGILARKAEITPGHLSNFMRGRNKLSKGAALRLQSLLQK